MPDAVMPDLVFIFRRVWQGGGHRNVSCRAAHGNGIQSVNTCCLPYEVGVRRAAKLDKRYDLRGLLDEEMTTSNDPERMLVAKMFDVHSGA